MTARISFEAPELDRAGRELGRRAGTARVQQLEIAPGVALELVQVPAGRFEMGSPEEEVGRWHAEGPRREVEVAGFWLGRYPVTQAQWRAAAALPALERALAPEPSRFAGDSLPVEGVSWLDAVELCARLARACGRALRLPSEAEWEYACRAGTRTAFPFGETLAPAVANYAGEPAARPLRGTSPVDRFPANRFGLHDMVGNVWEWCADAWHPHYEGAPGDGKPWLEGGYPNYRPLRGGAWCTHPRSCRSATRSAAHQSRDHRTNTYGLRVALSSGS